MAKTAIQILTNLKDGLVTTKQLTMHEKKAVVFFLFEIGKHHNYEIAEKVGYSPSRIKQLKVEYKKRLIPLINEIDVKTLAAETINIANRVKVELRNKGRWDKVWQVQKELVASLQELGYIHKAPIEHTVTFKQQAIEFYRLLGINKEVNFANSN